MFVILSEAGAVFNFCAIGTIFEIFVCISVDSIACSQKYSFKKKKYVFFQFDKLLDEIQFLKWYMLPKHCHKNMVMMFRLAGKPVRLTILDILPLNMDTFVIVSAKILLKFGIQYFLFN